ncbi:MAG: hypothetical protein LC772_04985 [Chloroflexi bacterium]|nr:hypothetical protein [Chloroflexota bacterium]
MLALDPDSQQSQGIFRCVDRMCTVTDLCRDEARRIDEMLDWFNANLPVPSDDRIPSRAIFWLKPACDEHRSRLWELAHFIHQQGLFTELFAVRHPGQIVYEDDFQVAAVPFWWSK